MSKTGREMNRLNKIAGEIELSTISGEYEDKIRLHQYSTYHFRVFNRKYPDVFIDIWCSSKKYYQRGMLKSKRYNKVKDLLPLLNI